VDKNPGMDYITEVAARSKAMYSGVSSAYFGAHPIPYWEDSGERGGQTRSAQSATRDW